MLWWPLCALKNTLIKTLQTFIYWAGQRAFFDIQIEAKTNTPQAHTIRLYYFNEELWDSITPAARWKHSLTHNYAFFAFIVFGAFSLVTKSNTYSVKTLCVESHRVTVCIPVNPNNTSLENLRGGISFWKANFKTEMTFFKRWPWFLLTQREVYRWSVRNRWLFY